VSSLDGIMLVSLAAQAVLFVLIRREVRRLSVCAEFTEEDPHFEALTQRVATIITLLPGVTMTELESRVRARRVAIEGAINALLREGRINVRQGGHGGRVRHFYTEHPS